MFIKNEEILKINVRGELMMTIHAMKYNSG